MAIVDQAVLEIEWMTFSAGKLNLGLGMPSSNLLELIENLRKSPKFDQLRVIKELYFWRDHYQFETIKLCLK